MRAARHVGQGHGARAWRALDATCRRGVSEGVAPGIVMLVGNSHEILFHRAYGSRALVPTRLPMLPDTVFDVASLTKPIATTTAMMLLARDGRVRLDDPVSAVVPEFSEGAKSAVTFRQLLNHTSGLPAWKPYYEAAPHVVPAPLTSGTVPVSGSVRPVPGSAHPVSGIPAKAAVSKPMRHSPPESSFPRKRESRGGEAGKRFSSAPPPPLDSRFRGNDDSEGWRHRVHAEPLVAAPGDKACYSDLGFILLGEAVERLTGTSLDRFCGDEIFGPLGLSATFFVDLDASCHRARPSAVHTLAATEDCPWRGRILCGDVHDDNAFAMGGVAGHAGLFSSAPDIHRFLRFLGRCREDGEPDFLPGAIVREFLEAERPLPGQTHVLGWDTPSPRGSSSGARFSARTVGHLGFTGTSMWWDMERDVHVILLTNRVHPSRDNDAIREFRPRVHDAAMEALVS
ncbi:MAG: serine hydrolase [Deltaproteobacteria bacterium]|nr:serine hydrolase [Deltaproteobacteria bacterium]